MQIWFFGHIVYWSEFNPSSSAFMQQRLEVMRASNPAAKLKYHWVRYERISEHLKRAVVAAEDARFLDHEGFDWEAIQIAMQKNEKRGKVVAGASTISQQLAKNLLLSSSRSWLRKGQEVMLNEAMRLPPPHDDVAIVGHAQRIERHSEEISIWRDQKRGDMRRQSSRNWCDQRGTELTSRCQRLCAAGGDALANLRPSCARCNRGWR